MIHGNIHWTMVSLHSYIISILYIICHVCVYINIIIYSTILHPLAHLNIPLPKEKKNTAPVLNCFSRFLHEGRHSRTPDFAFKCWGWWLGKRPWWRWQCWCWWQWRRGGWCRCGWCRCQWNCWRQRYHRWQAMARESRAAPKNVRGPVVQHLLWTRWDVVLSWILLELQAAYMAFNGYLPI